MIDTFADSFYYLALLNPRDAAHGPAVEVTRKLWGCVVTTQWVLTEVADALARQRDRHKFLALLAELEADPDVTILAGSGDLFQKGVDLYRRRPDKDWSLTDCMSFVVMSERGITEALTGDQHFKQAGFTALLAPP